MSSSKVQRLFTNRSNDNRVTGDGRSRSSDSTIDMLLLLLLLSLLLHYVRSFHSCAAFFSPLLLLLLAFELQLYIGSPVKVIWGKQLRPLCSFTQRKRYDMECACAALHTAATIISLHNYRHSIDATNYDLWVMSYEL